ncbi:MAG: RpoL/Rpb11 RNA polymerase subunit family protein [Candidatus Bathyarchaeia archaeon]
MKVNVVKLEGKEMKVEVLEEGHSLLNVLQKVLLRNQNIVIAGYDVSHPLVDSGILHVHTKGSLSPIAAVVEASKELKGEADEFLKLFEKSLKEFEKKTP